MNESERNSCLVSVGLGVLVEKIADCRVKIEDIERFIAVQVIPPDRFVADETEESTAREIIGAFASAVATQGSIRGIDRSRILTVCGQFGVLLGTGLITPLTIAILCNCGVSELEEILDSR